MTPTTADLAVADYDARDEEREAITWGLGGADAIDFTIDSHTPVFCPLPKGPTTRCAGRQQYPPLQRLRHHRRRRLTPPRPRNIRESTPSTVTVTNVDETPEIDRAKRATPTFAETLYDSSA